MMPLKPDLLISSLVNPQIKRLVRLHSRSKREREGVFLIEGAQELKAAFTASLALEACYYAEELFQKKDLAYEVLEKAKNARVPLIKITPSLFEKVSLREGPDGLLAVAPSWDLSLRHLRLKTMPFLLIVEGVEKPGNLGALMRSAEAAGVDALLLCDPVVDPFNPAVVRNSRGAMFSLPLAMGNKEDVYAFLKKQGVLTVATSPSAQVPYWEADLKASLAILMGSEKEGLSPFWLERADIAVKIPLMGHADSLNLATAAVLVLYEVLRQRDR